MALEAPQWLKARAGQLKLASDQTTWFVLIHDRPLYSLTPIPARGKHGCAILQTHNGRAIESPGTFPTPEDALRGGLEDLRKTLGW